ncbi:MBL fold metallo-hydrolase [Hydrogenothermus marinus]|uniref:Ribonuclease BN (tRNA processing enzyme) n=1 Tax=Hydrogenothermus marinus TaxID=133270 RepID=A0A3M0BV28_9AQUI|nr:MBL fold metallo-hydrolase [Hydrogenothermus marinus]RMB00267.1 ribonuclease BN (tRNA processing enzyme) [Hydrogenothermus marinus]
MLDFVKFLGTAGGRTVVFRQLRHSGGIWIRLNNINIMVDPGPGSLIRIYENNLEPKDIDIFVISHRHLDHVADINSVLEAATESTKNKKDLLIAPEDAIDGDDPVILKYLKKGIKKFVYTKENIEVDYKGVKVKSHIKHIHRGAEVYGLSFETENKKIVYVPCGKFYEKMLTGYPENADLMIINTTFVKPKPNVDHMSAEGVKQLLKALKPKKAVITHYSVDMLKANPKAVAKNIEEETGIPVIAAEDRMKIKI